MKFELCAVVLSPVVLVLSVATQVNVDETVAVKVIPKVAPEHIVADVALVFSGEGFTVIEKLKGVPEHPEEDGETVIVADIGVVPALVAANEAMSPVPLAAKPMEVLLLVQLNVVPTAELEKFIAAVLLPLQII